VLEGDAILVRIDPGTARITGHFATGAIEASTLIPADGYLWICECIDHEVLRFDPRTDTAKTFHFAQRPWHLVSVPGGKRPTLWLLDEFDATITRLSPASGKAGPPLELSGNPTEAVLSHGSICVAAGKVVDRLRLSNGARTTIALPQHAHATGIAVDPATGTIWVDNSRTEPR
jgi:streptogramin lyase